ncbi:hypothetical protein BXT84_14055 [Sulfobacillus thermotolerans]|uniref:Uncharacterized protein n=1 Tax=Sulfobacillus thermotolerans TaxID=338644 RepID=A0ABM6RTY0_9FIRM|nr:hypothetical protein BXT84_14055 [Sulfobacillus thermotolerans]
MTEIFINDIENSHISYQTIFSCDEDDWKTDGLFEVVHLFGYFVVRAVEEGKTYIAIAKSLSKAKEAVFD